MDAIPFAATRPEQVVSLYRSDASTVRAFHSQLAWAGSIAGDVLPAAGGVPAAPGGTGSRPAEAADVLLRLRFCPSAVQALPGTANPFSADGADGDSSDSPASGAPALDLAGGGDAAQRAAAASDGSSDDRVDCSKACTSPVELPPGAGAAQCEAAARLLACSEALLLLTEAKDAWLLPANVSAEVVPPAGGGPHGGAFDLRLSSDAVALWVAPEVEGLPGRFNASGLLVLPWQPQTVRFEPTWSAGGAATGGSGTPTGAPAAEAADGPLGRPAVRVYWLQQAMAELAAEDGGAGAAAAASSAATPAPGPPHCIFISVFLLFIVCACMV